jgi:hypothetical protein
LGESVASFVRAVRDGETTLVRPEEARLALATALRIEDTADRVLSAPSPYAAVAAAR